MMALRRRAQIVEDDAWLDARQLTIRVNFQHAVEVLRAVEHDRSVTTLPGEAGSPTAIEQRRAVLVADGDRRQHIVRRARDDDADGRLAVVRGVGGVEGARAVIEAHLACHGALQRLLQPTPIYSGQRLFTPPRIRWSLRSPGSP